MTPDELFDQAYDAYSRADKHSDGILAILNLPEIAEALNFMQRMDEAERSEEWAVDYGSHFGAGAPCPDADYAKGLIEGMTRLGACPNMLRVRRDVITYRSPWGPA
jgi:hypothetical protein